MISDLTLMNDISHVNKLIRNCVAACFASLMHVVALPWLLPDRPAPWLWVFSSHLKPLQPPRPHCCPMLLVAQSLSSRFVSLPALQSELSPFPGCFLAFLFTW